MGAAQGIHGRLRSGDSGVLPIPDETMIPGPPPVWQSGRALAKATALA